MGDIDQQTLHLLEQGLAVLDGVVFFLLAVVGIVGLVRHRATGSPWFIGMFVVLFAVTWVGLIRAPESTTPRTTGLVLAALALLPYLLYRFTRSFTAGGRIVDVSAPVVTLVLVIWALAQEVPARREEWTTATIAFVVLFLAHWTLLSAAAALLFLRESRRLPGVAARRMRLFAAASLLLAVTVVLAALAVAGHRGELQDLVEAAVQLAMAAAAVLFWCALVPPRWLRAAWRAREIDAMQLDLHELFAVETVVDVHERTLAAARRLAGGEAAALLDESGEVVAWDGMDLPAAIEVARAARAAEGRQPERARQRLVAVDRIIIVPGASTPFVGVDEELLLGVLSAFAILAEERAHTLARERDVNERLRQVDQLKTEFVAMVAHDLRSPMSVITGFADTIQDRWNELCDEDKLAYLRLISRNTRSLADFVEDVLQVARMESGELQYATQPFDARVVVHRIVQDMQAAHPELTLTVDAPDELPAALGDEERNWQILTNLVSNAVKFTDGHPPDIRVELRELPEEHAVAIAVRDNGIGISNEDLPRLFRRFSRVGPRRCDVDGSGLGLYIVKSMVEAQGGRIWVQSTPGEGSTFTYTLPIAGAPGAD